MGDVKTITVTGKGGTGKTMLATLMLKLLARRPDVRVLAIDADSASSLCYTLGIDVRRTVSDMRHDIIGAGQLRDEMEKTPLREIMGGILEHGEGFDLLTMGRPEEPGCYCAVNDLLKYAIDALARDYDVVVIDGEAGPEQINRRVMSSVDVLLVMSDGSMRSLKTANTIVKIAQTSSDVSVGATGLVLNRLRGDIPYVKEYVQEQGITVLGTLPEDAQANEFDRTGRPLLELPCDSPLLAAVESILDKALSGDMESAGIEDAR